RLQRGIPRGQFVVRGFYPAQRILAAGRETDSEVAGRGAAQRLLQSFQRAIGAGGAVWGLLLGGSLARSVARLVVTGAVGGFGARFIAGAIARFVARAVAPPIARA